VAFNFTQFVGILKQIGPVILTLVGAPAALIPVIVHGIELAEMTGRAGVLKRAVVLDIVGTAVDGINAVRPGTAVAGYAETVGASIDATVAVINLVQRQREALKAAGVFSEENEG